MRVPSSAAAPVAAAFEGRTLLETRRFDIPRDRCGLTPARISHIMALLNLAPDIQEAILFLPRTVRSHDPLQMYDLLRITVLLDWKTQRRLWTQLLATRSFG